MKLAIMQPYFLPYVGYYQLIAAADVFVVYDNIKYTKKGWINRNRMLLNGTSAIFTLPLKKGSDSLNVVERELAAEFDRSKLLNQLRSGYSRAPQFELTYPIIEQIVLNGESNLFRYIHQSIMRLCDHLSINTKVMISSEITIDHQLKGQDKVLALCQAVGADTYINTIGGVELYSKDAFLKNGIDLRFIKTQLFEYSQFTAKFVPSLSILDVLMFNPVDWISNKGLFAYELIESS